MSTRTGRPAWNFFTISLENRASAMYQNPTSSPWVSLRIRVRMAARQSVNWVSHRRSCAMAGKVPAVSETTPASARELISRASDLICEYPD